MENNKPTLIKDLGMVKLETQNRAYRRGIYRCLCGTEFESSTTMVNTGRKISCGCLSVDHGMSYHRLYKTWRGMLNRVLLTTDKDYPRYGGRGITVCDRWKNINHFIEDMYPSFIEGTSLDRINNDGPYSKDNCRWTTRSIQAQNTVVCQRNNSSGYRGVRITKNGKFQVRIIVNNKEICLGTYDDIIEAAKVFDNYVLEHNLKHNINGVLENE